MKRILAAGFAATLLSATGAFARAYPQTESPPKGSTVQMAPKVLWIEFNDELEGPFSGIKVTNAAGEQVDEGNSKVPFKDHHRLSVRLKPLAPGQYTVTWYATDSNTHKSRGSYSFTVAP